MAASSPPHPCEQVQGRVPGVFTTVAELLTPRPNFMAKYPPFSISQKGTSPQACRLQGSHRWPQSAVGQWRQDHVMPQPDQLLPFSLWSLVL